MTDLQVKALLTIGERPGLTEYSLSACCGRPRGGISRTVDALRRRGLVAPDALWLTPVGRELSVKLATSVACATMTDPTECGNA
jgi:hypothetical protein